jgi:hypothetical protein
VLAVVIVDPITAEMDAGDEAILGKLEEPGGSVQFCAFAPEAANNDNATAIPATAAALAARDGVRLVESTSDGSTRPAISVI